MNYTVTLSDHEQHILKYLAQKRQDENIKNNVKNTTVSNRNGYELNQQGLFAEYAFCKLYNLHLDLNYNIRSGSYDCLYKSTRIDIKSSDKEWHNLIAYIKVNPDVDVYVLAIVIENVVSFKGWLYKQEFILNANIKDINGVPTYFYNQEELRSMDSFKNIS